MNPSNRNDGCDVTHWKSPAAPNPHCDRLYLELWAKVSRLSLQVLLSGCHGNRKNLKDNNSMFLNHLMNGVSTRWGDLWPWQHCKGPEASTHRICAHKCILGMDEKNVINISGQNHTTRQDPNMALVSQDSIHLLRKTKRLNMSQKVTLRCSFVVCFILR